jgi:hypothetical protein
LAEKKQPDMIRKWEAIKEDEKRKASLKIK